MRGNETWSVSTRTGEEGSKTVFVVVTPSGGTPRAWLHMGWGWGCRGTAPRWIIYRGIMLARHLVSWGILAPERRTNSGGCTRSRGGRMPAAGRGGRRVGTDVGEGPDGHAVQRSVGCAGSGVGAGLCRLRDAAWPFYAAVPCAGRKTLLDSESPGPTSGIVGAVCWRFEVQLWRC